MQISQVTMDFKKEKKKKTENMGGKEAKKKCNNSKQLEIWSTLIQLYQ